VDYLSASRDRRKFAVLVGGGPTTKEWAKEIGADGCGMDAVEAVKLAVKYSKGR
jgi:trimethylamine corrinoid protein